MSRNCLECAVRDAGGFCSLADEALQRLSNVGDSIVVPAGKRLTLEGFYADKVFVVCAGQVKVSIINEDGRVLLLRVAAPGDVLGMAAALRKAPYESTAETIEPCELKVLPREEFLHFMTEFDEVGRNSAKAVAEEYRAAVLSARRLALSGSAAGKLASVLVEWAHKASRTADALEFVMPLTHEELGCMAGLSRETVTRTLSRFRKDGLIEVRGEMVTLLDEARLEALFS